MSKTRTDTYFVPECLTYSCREDAELVLRDRAGPCTILIEHIAEQRLVMEVLEPLPKQTFPHGHCTKSLEALAASLLGQDQRSRFRV